MLDFTNFKHIHCIGIGGIGLSAIAEIFLSRGYIVSGSDNTKSHKTEHLEEIGIPVTIGHDCWIGANVVICPGVTVGENCVIGAGSVVTRDIPANSFAAGNPARVIRTITDDERKYYFKDREFDAEAWATFNK